EAQKGAGLNKEKPRIEECLKWIEGSDATELVRTVVRRLARLRPDGTVAALLSFVARGEDEAIDEARQALVALAVRDGKPDAVLEEAAFKETNQPRRFAAIEVLCQTDVTDLVRKLLRDPSPEVRLHTASVRLEQGDAEAVAVLIDLLSTLPRGPRPALEPLERLAGPLAPTVANLKEARDAWADWWRRADADSLVKYFKERTPAVDLDRIGELVEMLGSKSFRTRNRAEQDLIRLRGLAVPWLERAASSDDIEVRRRATHCLDEIRDAPDAGKSAARVRLLARRRPPAAARRLLALIAFADSEPVVEEVGQALRLLARREPATTAALRAALTYRAPQRRAVAVEVLAE